MAFEINTSAILNVSDPSSFLCRCAECPNLLSLFCMLAIVAGGAILLGRYKPELKPVIYETVTFILLMVGLLMTFVVYFPL